LRANLEKNAFAAEKANDVDSGTAFGIRLRER